MSNHRLLSAGWLAGWLAVQSSLRGIFIRRRGLTHCPKDLKAAGASRPSACYNTIGGQWSTAVPACVFPSVAGCQTARPILVEAQDYASWTWLGVGQIQL